MMYWFVLCFVLAVLVYKFIKRIKICVGRRAGTIRPPIQQVLLGDVKYKVTDFSSPKLTGILLRILIRVSYTLFGRIVVVPVIVKRSNVDLLGGEYIPERPTLFPVIPKGTIEDNRKMNQKILSDIVDKYKSNEDTSCYRYTTLDYYKAYQSGSCTPLDVAKAVLDCIELSNKATPPLQAIIETNKQQTLKMAEDSTERWRKGTPLSLIDGVPFAVKSEFKIDEYMYSLHCGGTFKPIATNDLQRPVIIDRLLEAGGVLVGLANMQEFGTGVTGSNPHSQYRTTCNPYNTSCYPGGSSSGSAAVVSAGLCPITIGGDAGGSIRIPAALCGVYGLKTTFGYLPKSGFPSLVHSIGAIGPLGASTIDIAVTMDVMTDSAISLKYFNRANLEGVKIGIYRPYFEHASPEVVARCKEVVQLMESFGAQLIDIVIPELEEMKLAHAVTIAVEFSNSLSVDVDNNFEEFNAETLLLILGGQRSANEYINSQKQRTRAVIILQKIFEEVDVIVTPTTGCIAPVIPAGADKYGYGDIELMGKLTRFAFLSNLTGIPSVSVPIGYSATKLPIGLQLQCHWNEDGFLLSLSYFLEKVLSYNLVVPEVSFDIIGKFN